MKRPSPVALALGALGLVGGRARAQVLNPATEHPQETAPAQTQGRLRSWELPETVVIGGRDQYYREEDRVGPYGQPRWTARRLFPTTRVYVRSPGQLQFEWWTRAKIPREGQSTVETQYELEIGLPHRFQLDLYYVTEKTGSEGELDTSEQKYELRYALADWDVLWLNPTLYLEYVSRSSRTDKIEGKLLLGTELAPGWHAGANLVLEHELGDERENEYGITLGVARTVRDETLALGAELKAALVDVGSSRGHYAKELEIGPSMQWRPLPAMHVDFAPLIGIGGESRAADVFLVVGWEF